MGKTYFHKGKIVTQLFLLVFLRSTCTVAQLNLYNTIQTSESSSLHYDCLNYHVYQEKLAYQELSDVIDEVIPFCFRPLEYDVRQPIEGIIGPFSSQLSFEEMRLTNVTAYQLLSWSASIELAEQYQFYLNEPKTELNEVYYNCTPPRFGIWCQYSFAIEGTTSFNEFVEVDFGRREPYFESVDTLVRATCYILLECHRNGKRWCLDWREICDGKIDCFDEGSDEERCFEMEMNECEENEYRCHNGMCISEDLWEDGQGDTDCLDRSDSVIDIQYIDDCFQDPTFRCEEHSCETRMYSFSCGDGQCVPKFTPCSNGRHELLINSMTDKGNLTEECQIAMVCATQLARNVDGILCETLLTNSSIIFDMFEQCGSFFQFPTVSVYSNHVRFFFKEIEWKTNAQEFILPDYICYDHKICDAIKPELVYKTFTCIRTPESILAINDTSELWFNIIGEIEEIFRLCSQPAVSFHNKTNYYHYSSLYKCPSSSKFISKHRIMDSVSDCPEGIDEKYPYSCELNDRYRIKCLNTSICWSPLVKNIACSLNNFDNTKHIAFQSFCDGIEKYFYDSKGYQHNDEFGCGNWSCSNTYTRCDGYWTCNDGRDEYGCGQTTCPIGTYACLSVVNYSMICLPFEQVNDNITDCLGFLDEQLECQILKSSETTSYPFYCPANDYCLELSKVCDKIDDCTDREDEKFCQNQYTIFDQKLEKKNGKVEDFFRELEKIESQKVKLPSVYTSSDYPALKDTDVEEFTHYPTKHHRTQHTNTTQFKNISSPWHCNRGIAINTLVENNNYAEKCLCSPSYYGGLCQFQNQRVSLTLLLSSTNRHSTYTIVIMLIEESDEQQKINAYDQFTYFVMQTCTVKLNRYLLFTKRPKDISKNYSLHVEVFNRSSLGYIGSWYFPIEFIFLPVNRLGISVNLSNHILLPSSNCSTTCNHGQCYEYVNSKKSFCRCQPNWSGKQCNIPLNCQLCSHDSLCTGSFKNRSLCVCPLGKSGPRCLLISKCQNNPCQNHGTCIPADMNVLEANYTCLCPMQYFGEHCQYRKAKLSVTLVDIPIPSYLVAYFFTLSNKSDPIQTIILRKFTFFQNTVHFHITVPFQLAFIKSHQNYYLAALQQKPKTYISTIINPKQHCISVEYLLNQTVLNMIPYQRILYFHLLCQKHFDLTCFIDKAYLCLCTNDHHANCLLFNPDRNFQCPLNNSCVNHGQCLQDHPTCPSIKICLCPNCFFGDQCQFYAKGLGATLDQILGYQIKPNTKLSQQDFSVKLGAILTILILTLGIINGVLAILVFSKKASREVGCGIYLLVSSNTSLIIIITCSIKFLLLFLSNQHFKIENIIFKVNCFGIEPFLKLVIYYDGWLNSFVAIDRFFAVIQGVTFNKRQSKRIAKWVIAIFPVIVICLFVPQIIHLQTFDDQTEERNFCVVEYIEWIESYKTSFIYIHYFGPFLINLLSMILITTITAYQKYRAQPQRSYYEHMITRLKKHRHILFSTFIVVLLTLPHLIISFHLTCTKSSDMFWLSLIGYYLSFCPATFIFVIFVIPSPLYRKQFQCVVEDFKKMFGIGKNNSGKSKL